MEALSIDRLLSSGHRPQSTIPMASTRWAWVLAVVVLAMAPSMAATAQCSLSGRWTGFMGNVVSAIYDNYQLTQTGANTFTATCLSGPEPDATPSSGCGWSNGTGTIDSQGQVALSLNTGVTLTAQVNCASQKVSQRRSIVQSRSLNG